MQLETFSKKSIGFNGGINISNEKPGRVEAHGAHHQEEGQRDVCHIPEIKARLQKASHSAVVKVVEEAVGIDKDANHASREEAAPPPAVVFCCKLKVG